MVYITLEGYEVECPWHGSKFDVRTGEVTNPPAEIPQLSYEVKVENDKILVKEKPKSACFFISSEITGEGDVQYIADSTRYGTGKHIIKYMGGLVQYAER